MSETHSSTLLDTSSILSIRKNYNMFDSKIMENSLAASRFVSPSLRMTKIKSVQFTYKSPSRA